MKFLFNFEVGSVEGSIMLIHNLQHKKCQRALLKAFLFTNTKNLIEDDLRKDVKIYWSIYLMIDVLKIFSRRGEGRLRDLGFELSFVSLMPSVSYFDCPGKCLKSVWHFACLLNHDRINLRNLFRHSIFRIRWKDFSDRFWFNFRHNFIPPIQVFQMI